MSLDNVDRSKPNQARQYTAKQAITRIENIIERVQPPSARGWVLDYVKGCMTTEQFEAPDPRQAALPLDDGSSE